MVQTSFNFDRKPDPRPTDLFAFGTQCRALYEELQKGPVTNAYIVEKLRILKYTSRLSDLRKVLHLHNMDVEATRLHDGLFEYRLKGG